MDSYTDETGREWRVRELVEYGSAESRPGSRPKVVRSTVVFESSAERRVAYDAPPGWREREGALAALFARAHVPAPRPDKL